jgi:uncharacterized protein (DUF1697 family)
LATVTRDKPFSAAELKAEGSSVYIAFLKESPSDEAKQKLLSFTSEQDVFHVSGREVYWLCRQKFSDSKFSGARLEKTLGMQATLRNSTTLMKIASKYP